MRCGSCGTENDAGRKFCIECGEKLAAACPQCGEANPPAARFCGECGAALVADTSLPASVAERARPVAERRLVSVLFADLVGFTEASEDRDAEDTRELLSRYFETARRAVERYGGSVEKFIGDAVMAVWGAPVAHEDDAERAVRAALDLVETVGALDGKLRLRAGVLTGEAAVTIGASGEGMVAGDLVNTASRLQAAASPGSVLVGEATYRSTRQAISYESAGEHALKGKSAPMKTWRALRVVAARRGAGRSEGIEPPFVGREPELRQLKDSLEVTARDGRARLISIIGQPGIGKSRLARELRTYADGLAVPIAWHQGRSPAYGEGITYWALSEMVRQRAGLTDDDDAATTTSRLAAMMADLVADEAERGWVEPYLAALLGVGEIPPGEQGQQFAAWRIFFERMADRKPVTLVFEDLQWSDTGLIEFIESLLEWSRTHPILVITLARPELIDRHPSWGAAQRNASSLHLDPLDDTTMEELLAGVLPGVESSALRRVVERAGGVPLYAVETVRMLLDNGQLAAQNGGYRLVGKLDQLEVPHSLHALVAARLDTLSVGDRSLLQDAAVLGQSFALDPLAAVTGSSAGALEPRLRALIRRELLTLDADPRSAARGQYGFIQGVVREVAYETLSRRDRRARHLAAARHYESIGGEEAVLANHYLEAYRAHSEGSEADAVAAQARVALRAAADRAAALHSHDQAIAYLEQALSVTGAPAERATLLDRAAAAAIAGAREEVAERVLREAIEIHRESGDAAARALAEARLGSVSINAHRIEEAVEQLRGALDELSEVQDPALGRLSAELARAYMINEEPQALEMAERALLLAAPAGDVTTIAEALTTKGVALDMSGRHDEAIAILSGAVRFADLHGLVSTQLRATFNLAARLGADDPGQAYRTARDGVELARRSGMRHWVLSLTHLVAGLAIGSGEWEWVLGQFAELREGVLPPAYDAGFKANEGLIRALQGRPQEAERLLAEAGEGIEGVSDKGVLAIFQAMRGEAALIAGDYRTAYEHAMAVPEISAYLARTGYSHAARAAALAGDHDACRTALARLAEIPPTGRVDVEIGELARQMSAVLDGRPDEAAVGLRRIASFFADVGQPLDVGFIHLLAVAVLPADHPYIAVAATAGREIFERLGADGLIARLDEALARAPVMEAQSG
jgi:class 3 adenylate cyclase/tetratricopeptide (TPR) repeat protein